MPHLPEDPRRKYMYPQDLDPATQLLFEEASHTYAALSPCEIATCVTPEDFHHFWRTTREHAGLSFSSLHFGHYKAASFCPDLSLPRAAKLFICARNGVALARWGKGLTVLLEKKLGMFLYISSEQCVFLKPTSTGGMN